MPGPDLYANTTWDAEIHWFFIQGHRALEYELYIPGVLSLIAGIEATMRTALYRSLGSDDQSARSLRKGSPVL